MSFFQGKPGTEEIDSDGFAEPRPEYTPSGQFVIDAIGDHSNGYQDLGIEYYRYVPDVQS